METQIIYGLDIKRNPKSETNDYVILIDPRKKNTDYIKLNKHLYDTCLIKLLMPDVLSEQIILHTDTNDKCYVKTFDEAYSKEMCFVTSMESLIDKFNIVSISKLQININIDNIPEILERLEKYSHMISYIEFPTPNITVPFKHFELISPTLYKNRNLDIVMPKVIFGTFFETPITKFLCTYYKSCIKSIPYTKKELFHKQVHRLLGKAINDSSNEVCIIGLLLGITPIKHKHMKLLYPLPKNCICVDQTNDIIYASNTTMHILYNLLSNDYNNYVEKKKLMQIFGKKYFYEYLNTIFNIITIE